MLSLNESKRLRALHHRKERRRRREFLIEGPHVLAEWLDAGHPVTLVLYTDAAVSEPAGRALLERLSVPTVRSEKVSEAELRRHAGTVTPRGWVAAAPVPVPEWRLVMAPRVLVLDAVQDPGNVGTLIRAAEALGAEAVIALPGTADPWSPKAVRAAAGSSARLPILEATPPETIRRLRGAAIAIWVAASDGVPVHRCDPAAATALVLGNEGAGVAAALREQADRIVAIPMRGTVDSLNVALAGALLMDRLFGG